MTMLSSVIMHKNEKHEMYVWFANYTGELIEPQFDTEFNLN